MLRFVGLGYARSPAAIRRMNASGRMDIEGEEEVRLVSLETSVRSQLNVTQP